MVVRGNIIEHVLDLIGTFLVFDIRYGVSYGFLVDVLYQAEDVSLYSLAAVIFATNKGWTFSNVFFSHLVT